jgi:hypothetical protein
MFNLRLARALRLCRFFAIARRLVSPVWRSSPRSQRSPERACLSGADAVVVPAFLSTFRTYAVLRFFETRQRRWLFVAGLWRGGIAIKIVGVWFVVAESWRCSPRFLADTRRTDVSRRQGRYHYRRRAAFGGVRNQQPSLAGTLQHSGSGRQPFGPAIALIGYRASRAPKPDAVTLRGGTVPRCSPLLCSSSPRPMSQPQARRPLGRV